VDDVIPVHRWCEALLSAGRAGIVVCAFAVVPAATALNGCASFSPDGGMGVVSGVAASALGQDAHKLNTPEAAEAAHGRVRRLLAAPLSADAAVEIALVNNKGLQAAYNALGLAEAARIEASLPPNPSFSLSRISTPAELDVERRIAGDILALATLPVRSEIAADRFHQAQLRAAQDTLRFGLDARRSYYRAVAARQLAAFLEQAHATAETSAKLAAELGRTGAINKLDLGREQSFELELGARLPRRGSAPKATAKRWSARSACRAAISDSSCRKPCPPFPGARRPCQTSRWRRSAAASICRSLASTWRRSPSPTG
jgi:hypothetical protein